MVRLWGGVRAYVGRLRLFQHNAWLYLVNVTIAGISFGVFRLLFNFYAVSLGYEKDLIGLLTTITSLVALIGALPAGFLVDRLGRKKALLLSSGLTSAAVLGVVVWHTPAGFYVLNAVLGAAQSIGGVAAGPFLMENSGPRERTYLFSFNAGIQMIASAIGSQVGGRLPAWLGLLAGVAAMHPTAYGLSIALVGFCSLQALVPLACLTRPAPGGESVGRMLSPFEYVSRKPVLFAKLITPNLIISLGAGLLMPFMNLFFRETYFAQAGAVGDETIGTLFSLGALSMGLGLLAAPPLADHFGKMRLVVVTQALSIPFLVLLGFSPVFWLSATAYLIRVALMNMSGPVYSTFVMEQVEPEGRATIASLNSMVWNIGWAFSPWLSGILQMKYGFAPVFAGTISTYVIAIYLYWLFFVRKARSVEVELEQPAVAAVEMGEEDGVH